MLSLLAVAVLVATLATPIVVPILWREIEANELRRQFRTVQW
jgi:hypothetical protein